MTAATFAAVFVALFVAHQVADHWVQTDHQALHKGDPGRAGRLTCAAHVATYTATALLAVLALPLFLGLPLNPAGVAAGLAVSAVTHYIADRRTPLAALAALVRLDAFYALGKPRPGRDDNPCIGTGAYALDQSLHYLFLFAAALVIAA
ncbi:transcriptional regulator [Actinoplanes sp. ATCC 53533]|uniref:DUF3307 domain-containing protein n=1 Tax=Actinoplanes sp. ATCC 53533 TaxID=1288362 RepID=UPI000F7AC6B8|nr:DUF3307 domain-containing protein [Actinoplanes sp. ATCC 53533]RSM56600.1 transcriptional regulator [Actinoplanes sp. ATCC 53533]